MLVATLYTLSCVHGVAIDVGDAKSAVNIALQDLPTAVLGNERTHRIKLQRVRGHVSYKLNVLNGVTYFNCGLKPLGQFLLPETKALTVCTWFRTRNLLQNIRCYPPIYKNGGWFVNFVADRQVNGATRRFNYHLEVDHNAMSAKEQLKNILLSRVLE